MEWVPTFFSLSNSKMQTCLLCSANMRSLQGCYSAFLVEWGATPASKWWSCCSVLHIHTCKWHKPMPYSFSLWAWHKKKKEKKTPRTHFWVWAPRCTWEWLWNWQGGYVHLNRSGLKPLDDWFVASNTPEFCLTLIQKPLSESTLWVLRVRIGRPKAWLGVPSFETHTSTWPFLVGCNVLLHQSSMRAHHKKTPLFSGVILDEEVGL